MILPAIVIPEAFRHTRRHGLNPPTKTQAVSWCTASPPLVRVHALVCLPLVITEHAQAR